MHEPWIAIGGWGLPPTVLRPAFGMHQVSYVDANELLPALLERGQIARGWTGLVLDAIAPLIPADHRFSLAGWSIGAFLASAIAPSVSPMRLVCLSGFASFCTRPSHPLGHSPTVVEKMRRKLLRNPVDTMREFLGRCGATGQRLDDLQALSGKYRPDLLAQGLFFLQHCELLEADLPTGVGALVVHGKEDRIVDWRAGQVLANRLRGSFTCVEGGHLVMEHGDNVRTIESSLVAGSEE